MSNSIKNENSNDDEIKTEIEIEKTRGRPITVNQKKNSDTYFMEYYYRTKKDFTCECGNVISCHSMYKHVKSKSHLFI